MAARFWVGGTGNWDAVTTTNWSTSSGGSGGASVPGASDDVTFDASSGGGTVTVTATQSVNSITGGAFTGTLNTNGQSITTGSFNFSGSGSRTLTLGSSTLTITGSNSTVLNFGTVTNFTFNANTSTIVLSGNSPTLNLGGLTFNEITLTGTGNPGISGSGSTIATLTRTGNANKTDTLVFNSSVVVTSALNLNGNSATNRLLVQSSTIGSARTITNTGATMSWSNVDFVDITLSTAYDGSAISGNSGDCGGNTNITFTTSATQTYTGGTGNWSDVSKWTSRVPLPQDDVSMSGVTGGTIVLDMPRLGRSIDWTSAAGNPTALFSTSSSIFGSWTNISGMTFTVSNTPTMRGRGSFSVTSAGKSWAAGITFSGPGGSYTLNDALSTASNIVLNDGTLDTNGFNCTFNTFQSTSGRTRALTLGASVMTGSFGGGTTPWTISATGMTFSGALATVAFTGATSSTRTFDGGSQTYGTFQHITNASTGQINITGNNTFGTINFSDATNARTLAFTAGSTTTITDTFNVNGGSGRLITITSITASNHNLSKASGTVSCNYLSISRSQAAGGADWYAGTNSTDGSNNSGWIFTAPPSGGGVTGSLSALGAGS